MRGGTAVSATRYYTFGGQTVATRTSNGLGGVTSLVSDRDGSVVAAVPNTTWTAGSLKRVYSDPFGSVRGNTDAGVPGDHRFLGEPRDAASGLTLLGARYYDPGVGCFISVDPVLNLNVPAHLHAYAYGFNNPVSFSDASGMEPRDRNGKFDGNPYGGSTGGSPYSTGALESCTDVWCGLNWQLSNQLQAFGGCFEVLGGMVWSVMPPVVMWNAFSTGGGFLRDPGAHWAGVQEGWNNFNSWMSRPLVEAVPEAGAAWMDAYNDNPGHTLGYTTTFVGTLFIPGGAALKLGGAGAKAESALGGIAANQAAGNAARDALAGSIAASRTERTFTTTAGVRRVDILTVEGTAIEVKVGRTSLTSTTQSQIAKDQLLMMDEPSVTGIEWVFYRSGVTGEIGPTAPLSEALDGAGIPWRLGE